MPSDINTQLRKLPFSMLQKLEKYLEPPGDKDWKSLIAVMPSGRYDSSQVNLIATKGGKKDASCTAILIQDLCRLCITLKEFGWYLKKIKNYEALEALDWPNEPVTIKSQPECKVLREGDSLCLTVDAIGYPPPNYQWYKDDEEIPGEMLNELRVDKATMATDGVYKCILSNGSESSVASNEVTVRVMRSRPNNPEPPASDNPKPVITVHPVSANVLPGQHHTLRCEATGKHPMTYVWYKDGEQLLNTNSSTLDFPAFAGEHIGGYCCQISNAYGADVSQSAELALGEIDVERNVASDKVALLIGNQDYTAAFHDALQGGGLLQHTIADTKTLGSLLHQDGMGFNVLSLGNLTRSEMVKGIEEYIHLLSEDCYAFFYYAGHGFELNGKHYLLPVDAPAGWRQEDAICVQWVLELLWKARPKMTVIILDMCRVRPTTGRSNFEEYDFPTDLSKIVFGFATCSQSEAYERVAEDNGIYMKHLKNHICRDIKIEDVLHAVTTDVERDTLGCVYTERQRPEYVVQGGGCYSLRDPIEAHGNRSAERWLEAHKLPEKRTIEVQDGVKIEVRFEHSDWLSNSVNIVVSVIDPGMYQSCNAHITTVMPNELEMHFPPQYLNRELEHESIDQNPDVLSRSMPDPRATPRIPMCERSTGMFHLQRLHNNVTVTIQLDCESHDVRCTKYEVVAFSVRDFGLAQIFGN